MSTPRRVGIGRDAFIAWQCYQQVRSAYAAGKHADRKQVAEKIVTSFPSCPIRKTVRLGKTYASGRNGPGLLHHRRANNGGTDASPAAT